MSVEQHREKDTVRRNIKTAHGNASFNWPLGVSIKLSQGALHTQASSLGTLELMVSFD